VRPLPPEIGIIRANGLERRCEIERVYVDKGYRGHKAPNPSFCLPSYISCSRISPGNLDVADRGADRDLDGPSFEPYLGLTQDEATN
jgi:hypothetical protein